ncbi:WD domain-containing protein [Acrodontium crateriforme]|uniref:WD domain-containing protein n=1 Tax=Acrodontium crateriforme TaxID=150365 RepID=A0AAQ3RAE2_9PEZI|nr:WD domain-containing protein [Acrodontium crateriforme]
MSVSNDAGHFFQTSEALATTERKTAKAKNKHGNPIKLTSKILAVAEKDEHTVYVAEAAGEVKAVNLETNTVKKLATPAPAPLTSIAVCSITKTLFAGCWDKNIYATPLAPGTDSTLRKLTGHTDFVKCLLATSLNGQPILLSGAADSTIIVWDSRTGKQLHKLKGHTKALQDLAIDPLSLAADAPTDSFVLFSASSDREIRRWHISLQKAFELPESIEKPILAHETSIYKIRFDGDGDLWTASADKTAKHLVREREWAADTTLQHPDFVRDVLFVEHLGLVVTACRDEEVRVWDAGSGDCICVYKGHYEEVTGLALLGQDRVVSVSIDGSVRTWSLKKWEMARFREEVEKEKVDGIAAPKDEVKKGEGMLTAEEEAELAELMDDDDE